MPISTSLQLQESIALTSRNRRPVDTPGKVSLTSDRQQLNDHGPDTWGTVFKSFIFASPFLGFDWAITETTKHERKSAYYATVNVVGWNKPNIILRSRNDSRGNILAVAHCRLYRPVYVGIGDPEVDPAHVSWEMLKCSSWSVLLSRQFFFTLAVPSDIDTQNGKTTLCEKRTFVWERTWASDDGVDGLSQKMALRNYKLLDVQNKQIVAIFLAKPLWSLEGTGNLYFITKVPEVLEIAAFMTMASILLKWRRRE